MMEGTEHTTNRTSTNTTRMEWIQRLAGVDDESTTTIHRGGGAGGRTTAMCYNSF